MFRGKKLLMPVSGPDIELEDIIPFIIAHQAAVTLNNSL